MGKNWSILFAVTMAACFGLFLVAPFVGWWLPEGVSSHASRIDRLFYVILAITGITFVLTEALLIGFIYRYGTQADGKPPQPGPSLVGKLVRPLAGILNDAHKVEMAWTIVPAAILLYIAFAQVSTWAEVKYQSRYGEMVGNKTPVVVEVSARQFEWRMRYPGSQDLLNLIEAGNTADTEKEMKQFADHSEFDHVHVVNELHTWKDHPVKVYLSTRDVIHSFNLPHMRVKQDALPGKVIPLWFTPTKANTRKNDKTGRWEEIDENHIWDLACAELCGWGHHRMIGRLYVHENQEDFFAWLKHVEKNQNVGK